MLVDQRPRFAEWTSDDAEVWVSAEIGGTVSVIDNATRQIKKKITFEVPGVPTEALQPVGVRVTKDRKWAFVALGPANRVAVVNAQTFEVEKYLLVGQRVWQLAFSPDEKFVYSTNGVSNDISVIDVEALEVTKSVTGRPPTLGRGRQGLSETDPTNPSVAEGAACDMRRCAVSPPALAAALVAGGGRRPCPGRAC